jgi:putative FmdB family regulatory protein
MDQEVAAVPTYEYRCVSCEHQFERFQRMSDDPVTECEVCGQSVKRLLFPVAIHFKGSGFYSTDYSKRNTIGAGSSTGAGGSSEKSASDSSSDAGVSGSGDKDAAAKDKPAEKSASSGDRASGDRAPVAVKSD